MENSANIGSLDFFIPFLTISVLSINIQYTLSAVDINDISVYQWLLEYGWRRIYKEWYYWSSTYAQREHSKIFFLFWKVNTGWS